ncbi:unnamed protein product [Mycena citricolor]|uniref:Uncharacterized protein n=1 Tax=Mycena citricolor TaxID=2018698 RepID=A0AAD2GQT7_9AGAR|nr:unnamed protein product [Mycena citricolor]CAK5274277.1 unnamed protein product [Mycena citricolor]
MLSFRRTFAANPESFLPGHPYTLDNTRTVQISFVEFRAVGPPPGHVGSVGDVYVDLTPGRNTLHWRDRDGYSPGQWRKWTALRLDRVPLYRYLVAHPWANDAQISDLYLWADSTGITWTSRADICASRVIMVQKNIAVIEPGERNPDVDVLVSEILVKMIETEERKTLPPMQLHRDGYASPPPSRSHRPPADYPLPRPMQGRSHASSGSVPQLQFSPPENYRARRHQPSPDRPSNSPPSNSPLILSTPPAPLPRSESSEPHRRKTPSGYQSFEGTSPVAGPSTLQQYEPPNPHPGGTEQELRDNFAWSEMQRAQYAEAHFKRELRVKNRELAKFKKKEKDVISMSFMYQKKEQELIAALTAVEQRSQAEMEEQREAVRVAQRQVDEAESQARDAVRELHRVEDALSDARKEIQRLQTYADRIESKNQELRGGKEVSSLSSPYLRDGPAPDLDRISVPRGDRSKQPPPEPE